MFGKNDFKVFSLIFQFRINQFYLPPESLHVYRIAPCLNNLPTSHCVINGGKKPNLCFLKTVSKSKWKLNHMRYADNILRYNMYYDCAIKYINILYQTRWAVYPFGVKFQYVLFFRHLYIQHFTYIWTFVRDWLQTTTISIILYSRTNIP